MKLDTKNLQPIITKGILLFKKYAVFIFVLFGFGIFGFLVFRIRVLSNREPSDTMISDKTSQNKPTNIDESAVKRVEQLQSQNVEIKALFDQSRDNPFQE